MSLIYSSIQKCVSLEKYIYITSVDISVAHLALYIDKLQYYFSNSSGTRKFSNWNFEKKKLNSFELNQLFSKFVFCKFFPNICNASYVNCINNNNYIAIAIYSPFFLYFHAPHVNVTFICFPLYIYINLKSNLFNWKL